MMKNNQTSRRSFLGTLAILSAGAAFGSVRNFYTGEQTSSGLQQQWEDFCKLYGGQWHIGKIKLNEQASFVPCNGLVYKDGKMIHFPEEQILAIPTWIYREKEMAKPIDVVITFLNNDGQKICRMTRFEMEGLQAISAETGHHKLLPVIEGMQSLHEKKNKTRVLAKIKRGKNEQFVTSFSGQQTSIEKKLNY